ncbi:pentapeptide repeat-containing protein [Candidatus Gracilibacteria bacterium]|nr:pentapeptide repeat-containing protein [Candidatus Gracilibacteria bacterium]
MDYPNEKLEELRERWITPEGKKLLKEIQKSRCYLSPVLFREKVKRFKYLNDPEMEDGIDLRGAILSGFDFRVPVQSSDQGYSEDIVILSNIHFEGAELKHCNFESGRIHNCHFEDADLSHAEFRNATINSCHFQNADCSGINLRAAKLINCNFSDATIKDVALDSTITDEKTHFGTELKSEKEKNFHFASIEYKQIKEMYKNSSLHKKSDEYHYKAMVAKRRSESKKSPSRWLNMIFGDLLCKYGTSFNRVLGVSTGLILLCATIYTSSNSLFYDGHAIRPSFIDSLYFSIVTFTTLGYGDYHVVGGLRFLAAAEAFTGAALMALFTVVVARSIIRD